MRFLASLLLLGMAVVTAAFVEASRDRARRPAA
jgi:hypothetical protein